MKKFWKILDGNKTIICSTLLAALEAGLIPVTGAWLTFLRYILLACGGVSLYHHAKKKKFTIKSN